MGSLNDAKRRDFVSQIISLVEEEKDALIEQGFDPTTKITELSAQNSAADKSETIQQEIAAKAKEATADSKLKLEEAYKGASNLADLLSGILGKESEIVKKMRKFRS